jgi:hypothetical protein
MNNQQKGSAILWIIIVIILILVFAGGYFYLAQKKTPQSQVTTFDDSDMRVSEPTIPQAENSALDLASMTTVSISTSSALQLVNSAAQKPYFYCDLQSANQQTTCNLSSARTIANLAVAQSDVLYKQGNTDAALAGVFNVLDLGQKVENNSDALITYLVGVAVKKSALTEIEKIVQSDKLTSSEKITYNQRLSQDTDDVTGLQNSFKFEYQQTIPAINEISTGNYDPSTGLDKQLFDAYEKAKTSYTWNPVETQQMIYTAFKTYVQDSALACGTPALPIQKIDATTLPTSVENYEGKIFYAIGTPSLGNVRTTTVCALLPLYQTIESTL